MYGLSAQELQLVLCQAGRKYLTLCRCHRMRYLQDASPHGFHSIQEEVSQPERHCCQQAVPVSLQAWLRRTIEMELHVMSQLRQVQRLLDAGAAVAT